MRVFWVYTRSTAQYTARIRYLAMVRPNVPKRDPSLVISDSHIHPPGKFPCSAIVLDMNGVILQSNHLKHTAMLDLFARWPQRRGLIEAYNRGSGGIPRKTKFRHIWEQILRLPYDDAVELALCTQYALALADSLPRTPLVEGVHRLLTDAGVPIYVSSAAPQEELRQQLEDRRLAQHVANAFGYPIGKADALRQVVVQSGAHLRDIVFFGDSSADRDAAIEVGVSFIAVTREKNEFIDADCLKITDFQDWNAVCSAVLGARLPDSGHFHSNPMPARID